MTVDLDDPATLASSPSVDLLLALAGGAAQVRDAAVRTSDTGLAALVADGRPRAVLVCGVGARAIAGDVLAAAAGTSCPVPILQNGGPGLPAWAGVADLVVVVAGDGDGEQQSLAALAEAVRRGCRLLVVAPAGSPVAELGERGRAVVVAGSPGGSAHISLWAAAVPLLLAGAALGLLAVGPPELEETARALELIAVRCRPDAEVALNPAKTLAHEVAGTLPVVWGTSALTAVAAYRFACQINANAGLPAAWGGFPEVGHNQVNTLTGPWCPQPSQADFFRDRENEPVRAELHVVLLRDSEEQQAVGEQADAAVDIARERSVGVSALLADGTSALARLASVVGLTDFASVYLGLLAGGQGGAEPVAVPGNGRPHGVDG